MSSIRTATATSVISVKHCVIFGITASSVVDPASPPTAELTIEIRDSVAADGSGDLVAVMVVLPQSDMKQLLFPAGARCSKGVAVNMTLNGHTNVAVCVDLG
mgnify:CR=1 FL=1